MSRSMPSRGSLRSSPVNTPRLARLMTEGPAACSAACRSASNCTPATAIPAEDMIGAQLYVGPEAIEAGSVAISELRRARSSDFPSLSIVKGHRNDQQADLLSVKMPDSKGRSQDGTYSCVMDVRVDPPEFFVLNLREGIRHPRVYRSGRIPGTSTDSDVVCRGTLLLPTTSPFSSEWILAHLNQTMSVLNE